MMEFLSLLIKELEVLLHIQVAFQIQVVLQGTLFSSLLFLQLVENFRNFIFALR